MSKEERRNELNDPSGYGWTKTRPTKDGYYWHKDKDGRILILEWEARCNNAYECGDDIPWTYDSSAVCQPELADGWWWPEEITFNHNNEIRDHGNEHRKERTTNE